ncbi:MAG: hypothetical protein KBC69_00795 [Candidatus Magasanikbacteria bacterium]|nr:hypothetical protein [Candidatus Magasanikbacteria bacterium]
MPRLKILIYYILLLVLIASITGYLLFKPMDEMSMPALISACTFLVLYSIFISLAGETKCEDEREILHRNLSNRVATIAATLFISGGLIYQIFVIHHIDWWLLITLIIINLTKITSLIYFHYKK